MKRLMEYTVFRELVTACRFAASPTNRSPVLLNATTDGVTRRPSEFSRTSGSPPSITAMHELVVPKSIPITFAINLVSDCYLFSIPFSYGCANNGHLYVSNCLLTIYVVKRWGARRI